MRSILIFIFAWFILCCVSSKPQIQPCSQTLYIDYYNKGKKVGTVTRQQKVTYWGWQKNLYDHKLKKVVITDSVVIRLK